MSVELRCPDCRAKLRLPTEPEPGTEARHDRVARSVAHLRTCGYFD